MKPDAASGLPPIDVFFHYATGLAPGMRLEELYEGSAVDFAVLISRDGKRRAGSMRLATGHDLSDSFGVMGGFGGALGRTPLSVDSLPSADGTPRLRAARAPTASTAAAARSGAGAAGGLGGGGGGGSTPASGGRPARGYRRSGGGTPSEGQRQPGEPRAAPRLSRPPVATDGTFNAKPLLVLLRATSEKDLQSPTASSTRDRRTASRRSSAAR